MKELDAKEKRFVEEYLIDLDPKRAAIEAGYSQSTAASKAYQWVSNGKVKPHVYEAIQAALKARAERTEITQDRVLQELAKVGFSDLRNVFTGMGGIIEPKDWDDETAGAISSVEVVRRQSGEYDEDGNPIPEHVHKIKVWDKVSALEKMGKHLGMFVDRVEDVTPVENKVATAEETARAIAFILAKGTK